MWLQRKNSLQKNQNNDRKKLIDAFRWQTAMNTINNPSLVFDFVQRRLDKKLIDYEMERWLCRLLKKYSSTIITPDELFMRYRIHTLPAELQHAELLAFSGQSKTDEQTNETKQTKETKELKETDSILSKEDEHKYSRLLLKKTQMFTKTAALDFHVVVEENFKHGLRDVKFCLLYEDTFGDLVQLYARHCNIDVNAITQISYYQDFRFRVVEGLRCRDWLNERTILKPEFHKTFQEVNITTRLKRFNTNVLGVSITLNSFVSN